MKGIATREGCCEGTRKNWSLITLAFYCRGFKKIELIESVLVKVFFCCDLLLLLFRLLHELLEPFLKHCHMHQWSYIFVAVLLKKIGMDRTNFDEIVLLV